MARVVRLLDWAFIGFVLLNAAGHTAGSLATYPAGSEILAYALGMSVLALTCGTLNILRTVRPADKGVAFAALLASLGQAGVALGWGFAIRSPLDPRVLGFVISAGGLAVFSAAVLAAPRPAVAAHSGGGYSREA